MEAAERKSAVCCHGILWVSCAARGTDKRALWYRFAQKSGTKGGSHWKVEVGGDRERAAGG